MSALVARTKTAGGVGEVGRAGRRLRGHPPAPHRGPHPELQAGKAPLGPGGGGEDASHAALSTSPGP